jgi:hypothetical protein
MSGRVLMWSVLAVVAGWQSWSSWELRTVHPADGILAPDEPLQGTAEGSTTVIHGRWTLTPRASYDITARILSREDNRWDAMSDLSPEDLALGWGRMSDNRVLREFRINQGARFFSWRPIGPMPIPLEETIEHSSNNHLIPADAEVRRQIARLRPGQVVQLTGVLVDGLRDDGAFVRTSLTRKDTGAGACEILLVQGVEVL